MLHNMVWSQIDKCVADGRLRFRSWDADELFEKEFMKFWGDNFNVNSLEDQELKELITTSWPAIFLLSACEFITKKYNTDPSISTEEKIMKSGPRVQTLFHRRLLELGLFDGEDVDGFVRDDDFCNFGSQLVDLVDKYRRLGLDENYFDAALKFLALDCYIIDDKSEQYLEMGAEKYLAQQRMKVVHFLNSKPDSELKVVQSQVFQFFDRLQEVGEKFRMLHFYPFPFLLCKTSYH